MSSGKYIAAAEKDIAAVGKYVAAVGKGVAAAEKYVVAAGIFLFLFLRKKGNTAHDGTGKLSFDKPNLVVLLALP